MLAAGVNPLHDHRAAKIAADVARARAVRIRVGKLKEVAKSEKQEILDQLLARLKRIYGVSQLNKIFNKFIV